MVKGRDDRHYLNVGRFATVGGVLISIGAAFLVAGAPTIMDFTQTVFGFVNAPLLGAFLFGMFWKRTTPWGGFWGLIIGTLTAFIHWELTIHGVLHYHTDQAGNFWRAFIAFSAGALATYLISLVTTPKPVEELRGLVYSETPRPTTNVPWHERPAVFGLIVLAIAFIVNLFFW